MFGTFGIISLPLRSTEAIRRLTPILRKRTIKVTPDAPAIIKPAPPVKIDRERYFYDRFCVHCDQLLENLDGKYRCPACNG